MFPQAKGKWQVGREGTFQGGLTWRGDEIFFKGPEGKVMAAEVKEGGDSLVVSNPVVLFENRLVDSFDVTRDGQRILVAMLPGREDPQPLTIVTNWTAMIDEK